MMIEPIVAKKVDVIVDLQFGSTGKGLIAGYLAEKFGYDVVMSANMPNAGHTYINDEGRIWVHKVLPNGIVSPGLKYVMIGPGAIFSIERLHEEISQSLDILAGKTILVHPNAVVLREEHAEIEKETHSDISSTMQGSAAAMISKIKRNAYAKVIARDCEHEINSIWQKHGKDVPLMVCDHNTWATTLLQANQILLEGAQGYSLGINSPFYPYCTSRECTPARFMSDCAVPLPFLRRVIGTARVHPIRVGNTADGFSGRWYEDQQEISWEQLGLPPETTTVTGRIRRVFTFSSKQIRDAIFECQPDWVFLNFCNYDPEQAERIRTIINSFLALIAQNGCVQFTGWGPKRGDVREVGNVSPCDYTREEHVEGYV